MTRAASPDHAAHDELLLARFFGDDLGERERRQAVDLVASCPDCATFVADLEAISGATAALPVPPRPRDFSLTEADAARLRRGRATRLFGWLGRTRALGGSMAAVGLAGFVVVGALSLTAMTATSAPAAAPNAPEFNAAAPDSGAGTGDRANLQTQSTAHGNGGDDSVTDAHASPAVGLATTIASPLLRSEGPLALGTASGGPTALPTAGPVVGFGPSAAPVAAGPSAAPSARPPAGDNSDGTNEQGTGKVAAIASEGPVASKGVEAPGSVSEPQDWRGALMVAFAALMALGLVVLLASPLISRAARRR